MKLKLTINALVVASLSMPAVSSGSGCDGKITQLGIFANVSVVWTITDTLQRPWLLCSLTDIYNNSGVQIRPEVCKGIYALLLTAKSTAQMVHFELTSTNTCDLTNSWESLPFYNINLRDN